VKILRIRGICGIVRNLLLWFPFRSGIIRYIKLIICNQVVGPHSLPHLQIVFYVVK